MWKAHTEQRRILCTREYQSSIKHSVHRLLKDQITNMGLTPYFYITEKAIVGREHGSEFLFKGIHEDPDEIKSTEGVTDCWLEEAEKTTADSLKILLATIRKRGSQIIASWNPEEENSAIDRFARRHTPPDSLLKFVSWRDNPYRSEEMEALRLYQQEFDPDNYDWIWDGGYRRMSAASIFGKKVSIEEFEAPEGTRFFYGGDFGFAADPSVLLRCYIDDNTLYIDYEAYGYGVELDDLPIMYTGGTDSKKNEWPGIPGAREWPIKADGARPETISYLKRKGFKISAAEKWKGSVEDGIEHILGFKRVVIHKRCVKMAQEARLYSYRTDPRQLDADGNPVVLPEVVDDWNHGWDSCRYSLDGYIKHKCRSFFDIRGG